MEPIRYGIIRRDDFSVTGDLQSAYEYLKSIYEPKRTSSSGPVKQLSKTEKLIEANKATADMLKNLPEERTI